MVNKKDLKRVTDYLYEIPKEYREDMRVPARIYADERLLEATFGDRSLEQLVNTTTLPGIETTSSIPYVSCRAHTVGISVSTFEKYA